ncbi:TetR family transcriptional regulator [Ketogulonicigenium vulgare Y25]|uniref:Putative transcriptional regulator (TetR/AcrR family) n=2 Tax=Ketogulonicigenium vulgare TaxID=92945 RepID=F9Y7M1_KETVW|nr:TetR family transcriptional regulator [Ketogulonicigenium vulgare Y25]AEM42317.1 putative transcriptional regulator (TetR/AcrR family) [Ketogulonicigenium vulgare WSH-001]ALJ79941.1 TetR family transcriptional regulator [Ketogulonicigenium vulgare]ANW32834.1 TetR family transcriptional regulator [Ketogulonicigenium vulgare]AOZ53397.1 TetR family transcriptional regulator [Ketogulonicigenium vulgare]
MDMLHLTPKATATRLHILKTGEKLVQSRGFSGLGLQQILQAAGVPKGSFYHYFASKEAFGVAMLQQYMVDYAARFEVLMRASDSGRALLLRYLDAWITDPAHPDQPGWAEGCLVVKLSAEVADLSEDMRLVLADGITRITDRMAALIAAGQADGSVPAKADPQGLAVVLYQLLLGAAVMAKVTRTRAPLDGAATAARLLLACGDQPNT